MAAQPKSGQPRVLVVGAGAFGGWTALHLLRRGASVTLVDAWGPGNARASSGGETRVIRAVYGPDRVYSEMVRRSYELWNELRDPLYVETGVLWMHRTDDTYVRSSLPIVRELGFPVEEIAPSDAAARYPQIDFRGVKSVFLEKRAGVLSARRACTVVCDLFERTGGVFRIQQVEPGAIPAGFDAVVFACGAWLGQLFPRAIGDGVRATRQDVLYFGTPRGSDFYRSPRLPVWIDFGPRIIYGVPDLHGRGLKVADDTRGEPFDPTTGERVVDPNAVARARALLAERFPGMARAPLVSYEVCQYENSPDGNLIIDRDPAMKNVWFVGGGSGHGFKLSPAVGEIAASAILDGKEVPALFRLGRLQDVDRAKTQFETKS